MQFAIFKHHLSTKFFKEINRSFARTHNLIISFKIIISGKGRMFRRNILSESSTLNLLSKITKFRLLSLFVYLQIYYSN